MDNVKTGGCACGTIRYQINVEPEFSMICQCRQCQRITGAGHAVQFAVNVETADIEGSIKFYELTSDDGNTVSSGFCANCGSPVLKKSSVYPQFLMFHAATLDDPSTYQADMVLYSQFKQPWDKIDPSLPRK